MSRSEKPHTPGLAGWMALSFHQERRPARRQRAGLVIGITVACMVWLLVREANLLAGSSWDEGLTPQQFLPLIQIPGPQVRISAVYYDGYATGDADEAIQLWNVGVQTISLAGWKLGDGSRTTQLPAIALPPGAFAWCAREAVAFRFAFGHAPDCEWGDNTDPTVPNAQGGSLRLSNQGARITLYTPEGGLMDVISYANASAGPGWDGPPVRPYTAGGLGMEGQILYRKLDARAQPLPDTDRAADWATDPADPIAGRRVRYPGWDLEAFWPAYVVTETARLTVTIAPDNMFETILAHIQAARESIALEGYVLESVPLGLALAERAQAGVTVRILLEGAPSGGIRDVQRWITQHIVAAGGQVYYMVNDRNQARDRYRFQHAKLMILDSRIAYIGSENFSEESMPSDDKRNGTQGRRGVGLLTDAPGVVARARALIAADLDPSNHADIFAWDATDPVYGPPPDGYIPPALQDGIHYQVQFATPLTLYGTFAFEVVQSPETSLRIDAGLLPLITRAGAGDTVLVEQLYEHPHWGPINSTPADDPNPRLEAYLAAARRGARVRVLLDRYLDDPRSRRSNEATIAYLNEIARQEGLDLEARRGNPTYLGLHNKMVLVEADGRGWAHVGSLNGSEVSAKVNRELALQVQSDEVYRYLAEMFWRDWEKSRP
ncbi:MAG: phospholipase D-like domain-containing protein [Anaerolineae bacterium]|nr:phospholipase D-like domain-containing protein [Anaerolineae bacterium]MDW8098932.1 phospholipase D-like domain-containing protein [Anaerolineae bacterium]